MNKKLFATTLIALGITLFPMKSAYALTYPVLDASIKADKEKVAPGEVITYTIDIKNITDETVDPIFIAPGFNGEHAWSPYVDYIPGSTIAYKGVYTKEIVDAWLTDGMNLGKFEPGVSAKVVFQAKVKSDAPNGGLIESVIQIKKTWLKDEEGNIPNEWVQCASKVTIDAGDVLGAELPQTGAQDVFVVSGYALYLGVLVRKLKLTKFW